MTADETAAAPADAAEHAEHVRLRVELVVEIADAEALTSAALERIEGDELMPDEERAHARRIVVGDPGEAIAYLVDPFELVSELPGVELAHASWGSEQVTADALEDWEGLEEDDDLD